MIYRVKIVKDLEADSFEDAARCALDWLEQTDEVYCRVSENVQQGSSCGVIVHTSETRAVRWGVKQ